MTENKPSNTCVWCGQSPGGTTGVVSLLPDEPGLRGRSPLLASAKGTIARFDWDSDRVGCRAERGFRTCLWGLAPTRNGWALAADQCDTKPRCRKRFLLDVDLRHTNWKPSTIARPSCGESGPVAAQGDAIRPGVDGPWSLSCAAVQGGTNVHPSAGE